MRLSLSPKRADRIEHVIGAARVDGDCDVRATGGIGVGDRRADAGGASGDERTTPLERECRRPDHRRDPALPLDRDVLGLEKLHDAVMRALAADAGLLHAAERRRRIGDEAAVQADHAEIELFGEGQSALQIAR